MTENSDSNFIKCLCRSCSEKSAIDFLNKYGHLSLKDTKDKLGWEYQDVLDMWELVKPYLSKWDAQRDKIYQQD